MGEGQPLVEALAAADPAQEDDLVARAQAGERRAFSALVGLHQAFIRGYIAARVFDAAVVDDLAQEAFVAAYRELGKFRRGEPLRAWLTAIARHHIFNHFRGVLRAGRRHGGARDLLFAERELGTLGGDADGAGVDRALAALEGCLHKLAPEASRLVAEHYVEGRSMASIAAAGGRKENAVRMQLLRIRKALRACLDGAIGLQEA